MLNIIYDSSNNKLNIKNRKKSDKLQKKIL